MINGVVRLCHSCSVTQKSSLQVQEKAVHERLAMQVNLNLDMERMLPNFIKRRYIIKEEEVFPNAPKSVLNTYMLSDNDTLQRIVDEVVAKQTDVSSKSN